MNDYIDNLELIKPLLNFTDEGDFYFIQIFQRKKDNPNATGLNSTRTIKSYYVDNIDYLESHYDNMKNLAKMFNSRVMINLNKRNYQTLATKMIRKILDQQENNTLHHLPNAFNSVCGKDKAIGQKHWIIDIDGEITISELNEYIKIVNNCMPVGNKIIKKWIPSLNGGHIITKPFNIDEFYKVPEMLHKDIDIKKNNPTNLYIPPVRKM